LRTEADATPPNAGRSWNTISAQREHNTSTMAAQMPPDLRAVVGAWPYLPEAIKQALRAMVHACRVGRP
jgi:hypothetical protein